MGSITSLFVRKVVDAAAKGVEHDALLRSIGLDPSGESNVAHMVSDHAYYALLERANAENRRQAASSRASTFALFGLIAGQLAGPQEETGGMGFAFPFPSMKTRSSSSSLL